MHPAASLYGKTEVRFRATAVKFVVAGTYMAEPRTAPTFMRPKAHRIQRLWASGLGSKAQRMLFRRAFYSDGRGAQSVCHEDGRLQSGQCRILWRHCCRSTLFSNVMVDLGRRQDFSAKPTYFLCLQAAGMGYPRIRSAVMRERRVGIRLRLRREATYLSPLQEQNQRPLPFELRRRLSAQAILISIPDAVRYLAGT